MKESLPEKMEKLADSEGLPEDHELRIKAQKLREAAETWQDPDTGPKQLLGAWARARRVWAEWSGEEPI